LVGEGGHCFRIGKDYFDYDDPEKPILDDEGNIKADTISKWGLVTDGADIEKSGVESKIPTSRTVLTTQTTGTTTSLVALDTSTLDASLFDVATNPERDDIVNWALGKTPYDKRHIIGDPLHSQPVIVKYKDDNSGEIPYVFFSTNDGFLHAVNLISGVEAFAFIPEELLRNLKIYKENAEMSPLKRPYGLDGEITVGKINDKVMLYFGMRRGGSNYYALDVSTIGAPEFVWQINGGSGGTTDYEEMGQTWSKPLFAKVNFEGAKDKIVLIVSGGYDKGEDNPANLTGSTVGRAIYIIDATNGERLWWAHSNGTAGTREKDELIIAELDYSIPSSIAALDVNYDDVVDRLYFIDIAGQLFRVDLDATKEFTDSLGTTVKRIPNGGLIAKLRGTAAADKRRFYNEPEIVLAKFGTYQFARINVGSGYRANPTEIVIQDRFYSIRDDAYHYTKSYTAIEEGDLFDATNAQAPVDGNGWYIDLPNTGEKALSQSMTLNNHLMFTTYTPPGNTGNSCEPPAGTATFYMVDLFNGNRQKIHVLDRGGIPPAPMPLIFDKYDADGKRKNPELAIAVGMEFIKDDKDDDNPLPPLGLEPVLNKNFWVEK